VHFQCSPHARDKKGTEGGLSSEYVGFPDNVKNTKLVEIPVEIQRCMISFIPSSISRFLPFFYPFFRYPSPSLSLGLLFYLYPLR
jgi:hypothetical protein